MFTQKQKPNLIIRNFDRNKYTKGWIRPESEKVTNVFNIHKDLLNILKWDGEYNTLDVKERDFIRGLKIYLLKNGFVTIRQKEYYDHLLTRFRNRDEEIRNWLETYNNSPEMQEEYKCALKCVVSVSDLHWRGKERLYWVEKHKLFLNALVYKKGPPLKTEYDWIVGGWKYKKVKDNLQATPKFIEGNLVQFRYSFFRLHPFLMGRSTLNTISTDAIRPVVYPLNAPKVGPISLNQIKKRCGKMTEAIFTVIQETPDLMPISTAKGARFYSVLPFERLPEYRSKLLYIQERFLKKVRS